jgi:cytochrome c5
MHSLNCRLALTLACTLALALALVGCGRSGAPSDAGPTMPKLAGEQLGSGRGVWLGTCRACHLLGIAGAPAVTNFAEWDRRLAKGKEALYQSALNGIKGPDGQYRMPPHGGNPRLSVDQVRLAVDYKVAAIEALRTEGSKGGG